MKPGRSLALAAAAAAIVLGWFAFLLASTAHVANGRPANERVERVERYGNELQQARRAFDGPDDAIVLSGKRSAAASGSWTFNHYELAHDIAHATSCDMTFYAAGLRVTGLYDAAVRVFLNGVPIRTVRFSTRQAASFPSGPTALVPDNVSIGSIELAPLDRVYALEAPVDPAFCTADRWTVRIEAANALWTVTHVGLIVRFTPARRPFLGSSVLDAIAACLELLALAGALVMLLWNVAARIQRLALIPAALLAILAPLTHDQWDFPIWLRFTDLVAYGHGNPAAMWFGTPLWAFLPGSLAPVIAAANTYLGNGSQDVTAILLKGAMALAAIYNALTIAGFAPKRLRRLTFLIVLAAPVALYQVGAGYREVFAAALALTAFRCAANGKLWLAAAAFTAGASISESLLPLVAFPAALALLAPGTRLRGALQAIALAIAGFGVIAFQWLTLVPIDLAKTAISNRVVSYRYGGGSWFAGLNSFGLLPDWVGPHSFLVVGAIFTLLAVWPLRDAVLAIVRRPVDAPERLLRSFVCFIVAFFLSYRGVDPSTWYALFAMTAFFFARVDPTNPFPLLLGTLQGAAFYAILGLGDFVNWTFLWPHDTGLLGTLGRPVDALELASNALTLVLYLMLATPLAPRAFSARTIWFIMLFFGALANAAIKVYAADVVVCTFASAIAVATIGLMLHARRNRTLKPGRRFDGVTAAGFGICLVSGAAFGAANPAAGLTAITALLIASESGFGLVDVVLIASACLLLSVDRGFGYVSIAGWIVLALIASYAIVMRSTQRRPAF